MKIIELPRAKDPAEWFARGPSELELIRLVEEGSGNVLPVKFDIRTHEAIQAVEEQLRNSGKLNGHGGSHAAAVALPKLVSAADRYRCEVTKLRPLFEDLAWDGLTMITARPKAGKSSLTLQAAIHIAGGKKIEGITALDLGPVLYGAIEEPAAWTMSRLRKIEWSAKLHFVYELLPAGSSGIASLICGID